MRNLVIGGGISGLVFAFYNPEFTLISQDLGGMLQGSKTIGGLTLWDTTETRQLLTDLGMEVLPQEDKIYYYFNNRVYEEAPLLLRKEYLKKRLGELSLKADFTDLSLGVDDSNIIPALKVDFQEFLKRLISHIEGGYRYKEGLVTKITDNQVYVLYKEEEGEEVITFDKVVSTIPAPIFWNIWQGEGCYEVCKPKEFQHVGATYVYVRELEGLVKELMHEWLDEAPYFKYLYFLDGSPFHRVTKANGGYSIHFTGRYSDSELSHMLKIPEDQMTVRVEKYGQFLNHYGNSPPKNISFLGRFAEWKYRIKTQHIVRRARYSKFMLDDIRNRQTRFNKNFIVFNELNHKERQRLTEKWILYIISEVDELLQETNWKLHRPDKELSRAKILEEWIDMLKFVLGIADIWGFSNAEIFEAFHSKSDFVEKRFREEGMRNVGNDA